MIYGKRLLRAEGKGGGEGGGEGGRVEGEGGG